MDNFNKKLVAYYKIKTLLDQDEEIAKKYSRKDKCVCCMGEGYMIEFGCKHAFCYECFSQFNGNWCPYCRKPFR